MNNRWIKWAVLASAVVGVVWAQQPIGGTANPQGGVVSGPRAQGDKNDPNLRTIGGLVTDAARNPVPKAIVQLKDMKTLQIRSFITQADGTFHFAALRMDTDYELKASLGDENSSTKRVSSFESRNNVTVNLQLEKK